MGILRATRETEDFIQSQQQREGWSEAGCGLMVGQDLLETVTAGKALTQEK